MSKEQIKNSKIILRERLLEQRRSLNKEFILKSSLEITKKALKFILKQNKIERVHIYISRDNEVETRYLIEFFRKNNIEVFVPDPVSKQKVVHRKLIFIKKGVLFSKEIYKKIENLDLIIIPGICFDKNLNRLGYGGGYYDKFLENQSCLKIGLAYDFQITKNIPTEKHDQVLNLLLSEKKVYE